MSVGNRTANDFAFLITVSMVWSFVSYFEACALLLGSLIRSSIVDRNDRFRLTAGFRRYDAFRTAAVGVGQ